MISLSFSSGGYVAGGRKIIEFLRQKARPFLFSSATTAADTAACTAAVDMLESGSGLVERLWENAGYFQGRMRALGFDLGRTQTPITPVIIGDVQKAREMSRRLFEEGVFAQAIGFPTVPEGRARIRCMVSAVHTKADLDFAVEKFEKVRR